VLAQKWTEGKRRILIICPANLRKQWSQEMAEKFFLPTVILETAIYNRMCKAGVDRPFEQPTIIICSFQFAARQEILGQREKGTARLEEAVAAYCEALQELTRARVSRSWASVAVAVQWIGGSRSPGDLHRNATREGVSQGASQ
jgi:hypothetical protein